MACSRSATGRPSWRHESPRVSGCPGNPPEAAAASGNKLEARATPGGGGAGRPVVFHAAGVGDGRRAAERFAHRVSLRAQTARPVGQPRRHPGRLTRGVGGGVRPHQRAAGARRRARGADAARDEVLVEALHPRTRVRRRRRADRRRAAGLRDLRQARPARWPVLRGNDLRHAVLARPRKPASGWSRRFSRRPTRSASGTGRSTPSAASARTASSSSRSRRGRSAGCARRRCGSADGSTSLEDVLLRHAIGEDVIDVDARDARPPAVMMIPIPKRGMFKRRRRRGGGARACRASRTCASPPSPGSCWSRCPEARQLPRIHLRARARRPRTRMPRSARRTCAAAVHD